VQFLIIFAVSIAVLLFFMLVLSRKKPESSCGCGKGNCQTGNKCENTEEKDGV